MSEQNKKIEAEKPTKSQMKKDMHLLQKMGEALINLSESQLAKMPLPNQLREAIEHARTLKNNESRRRQLQFIGKIMREIETQPIRVALDKIRYSKDEGTKILHKTEEWRTAFLAEGDAALERFIAVYPDTDHQQLRQLIRKAKLDESKDQNLGAHTKLFRYIRDILTKEP